MCSFAVAVNTNGDVRPESFLSDEVRNAGGCGSGVAFGRDAVNASGAGVATASRLIVLLVVAHGAAG